MSVKDLLIPYKKGHDKESNHSISEAVLVIYLANEIINPERFKDLILTGFKDIFNEVKDVVTAGVQVSKSNEKPTFNSELTGFSFKKFASGKPEWVLNANNKPKPHIAIHCLNYTRWIPFIEFVDKAINILGTFDNGLFITALGLNYIDQFNWIGDTDIDYKLIFNTPSKLIPSIIYEDGADWGVSINLDGNGSNENKEQILQTIRIYSRRISKQNINLGVVHNSIYEYSKPLQLSRLFENTATLKDCGPLNDLHLLNKSLLKRIFSEEVLSIINLK